jgi:hypothetical protein
MFCQKIFSDEIIFKEDCLILAFLLLTWMTTQIHCINHDDTCLNEKCGSIVKCNLEITRGRFNNMGTVIGFPILKMILHVGLM